LSSQGREKGGGGPCEGERSEQQGRVVGLDELMEGHPLEGAPLMLHDHPEATHQGAAIRERLPGCGNESGRRAVVSVNETQQLSCRRG
jgi:hypothetical protein